jgi:hypothetical protein
MDSDLSEPPPGYHLVDAGPDGCTLWQPETGLSWPCESRNVAIDKAWIKWRAENEPVAP